MESDGAECSGEQMSRSWERAHREVLRRFIDCAHPLWEEEMDWEVCKGPLLKGSLQAEYSIFILRGDIFKPVFKWFGFLHIFSCTLETCVSSRPWGKERHLRSSCWGLSGEIKEAWLSWWDCWILPTLHSPYCLVEWETERVSSLLGWFLRWTTPLRCPRENISKIPQGWLLSHWWSLGPVSQHCCFLLCKTDQVVSLVSRVAKSSHV